MQETNLSNSTVPQPEKKEAVEETLRELKAEKKQREANAKKRGARRFFKALLWPFTAPFRLLKKIRVPLTVKMLLIFSVFFSAILVGFTIFIVYSVANHLAGDSAEYMSRLISTSAIIVSASIITFTALTGVISSLILNPIRRITKGIDDITAEDLSKRLEAVDTQDELMELTNRINGMLDNIEETFRRQENFVADASHELKTPLAVISGYVNLLKRWGAKDENILGEAIEAIHREAENMRRMVEQLLLLARIGAISMNVTSFCADEVLRETVEGYVLTEGRHIEYEGGERATLETDKNLLIELVRILINNALKYSPVESTVQVKSVLQDETFTISVTDNGAGISEADIPHIFDRFYRCDKVRGRESGGTGLGLTIAKSIVETLGGKIEVNSVLGEGSVFTVQLHL